MNSRAEIVYMITLLERMKGDYEKSLSHLLENKENKCDLTYHGMCNYLLVKERIIDKSKRDKILVFLWIFSDTPHQYGRDYWFPTIGGGHHVANCLPPRIATMERALVHCYERLRQEQRKELIYAAIAIIASFAAGLLVRWAVN